MARLAALRMRRASPQVRHWQSRLGRIDSPRAILTCSATSPIHSGLCRLWLMKELKSSVPDSILCKEPSMSTHETMNGIVGWGGLKNHWDVMRNIPLPPQQGHRVTIRSPLWNRSLRFIALGIPLPSSSSPVFHCTSGRLLYEAALARFELSE